MLRNRLLLILLLILSLVSITIYGTTASYVIFFACLTIPIVCIVYLGYVFLQLKIYQELGNRYIVKGESVPYKFILSNEDFIAYSAVKVKFFKTNSTVENIGETIERELLPKDHVQFNTIINCKYRGEYPVGVKEVTITDFLQLFRFTYHVPFECKATVFPKIVELQKLTCIPEEEIAMLDPYAAIKSEPDVTVRNYVSGDSLKQIHWKLSAKENKLKTRELSGTIRQKLTIIIDLTKVSKNSSNQIIIEDKIIECAVSLIRYFCYQKIPFYVGFHNGVMNQYEMSEPERFYAVYEDLAKSFFISTQSLESVIDMGGFRNKEDHLIWITHGLNKNSYNELLQVRKDFAKMTILSFTNENLEHNRNFNSTSISLFTINPDADLREVL